MKSQALYIVNKLREAGHQAVFAGGCVRDLLLGIEASDIDIATSALPDQVEALFEKTIAVGRSFGVLVVVLDGIELEVATFRRDSQESDGRHPDSVSFSSMEEDALRRDLTINGMFYDPLTNEIIDFVGGQEDLKRGVVRFIGDPDQRIEEDKLRLMRAIRFASRFEFKIDPESWEAIKRHVQEIKVVSEERIADELLKILRTRNVGLAMDLLFESKLIDVILPEVAAMKGVEQPIDYHPEGCVFTHTLMATEMLPENASDELLMATLLHDVGKPVTQVFADRIRFNTHELKGKDIARDILKRLKFSNDFIDRVCCLVGNHMKTACVKKMRISRLKRYMAMPYFEEHIELHRVDCLSSHGNLDNVIFLEEKMKTFNMDEIRSVVGTSPSKRILTGDDLIQLGYRPGPEFRRILTDVEDRQLEGTLIDKDQAISYVLVSYNQE
jgi:poly(A) polymerase